MSGGDRLHVQMAMQRVAQVQNGRFSWKMSQNANCQTICIMRELNLWGPIFIRE